MSEAISDRRSLLEDAAASEGSAWADWWRSELRRQSRPVAGGWPGTLSEARMRIANRITREFGPAFRATAAEIDVATRSVYVTAKRSWDDSCEPDDDPCDVP